MERSAWRHHHLVGDIAVVNAALLRAGNFLHDFNGKAGTDVAQPQTSDGLAHRTYHAAMRRGYWFCRPVPPEEMMKLLDLGNNY